MPTILHPWARVRDDQQVDTLRFLMDLHEHSTYRIRSREMIGEYDYAKFLRNEFRLWGPQGPIYIVEQDIAPTLEQLYNLNECYDAVCVYPYRLREGQWSIWEEVDYSWDFYGKPPTYVPNSALGFIKFSRQAIRAIQGEIPDIHWSMLDSAISSLIRVKGFHIHVHEGEVKHNRTAGDMR